MSRTLRGRPRLNITMPQITEAVRRHGQVMSADRELGCSDAYRHVRLKAAALTIREVLEAEGVDDLLRRPGAAQTITETLSRP